MEIDQLKNLERIVTNNLDAAEFDQYKNTTQIPLRTMVPMCLWVNKKDKLSRIDCPHFDKINRKIICNMNSIPWWQEKMKQDERNEWKKYDYWVFNVLNLPPRPYGMQIWQVTNKSESPWNNIGLAPAGSTGVSKLATDNSFTWEQGIFKNINDDKKSDIWRFITYSQPVPNTKKLYIYNTNRWNVSLSKDNDMVPNPNDLFSAKQSKDGKAGPVGINAPAQLYITPDEESELSLAGLGGSYIWVCEKEYTQFACTESLIIPYTDDLNVKLGLRTVTPLGYWSAMKKVFRICKIGLISLH